jgi:hypothetical protein
MVTTPREVELLLAREGADKVGGVRHVLERAGPAAAVVPEAAIFDAPGGDARVR